MVPYEVASYVELDPSSAYYDAALDYLTTEGALVPHESIGSGAAYRITWQGLCMLEG